MQALLERIVPFQEVEGESTRIELAFDRSAIPYIEQFLYARDVMYLSCYEKPKKIIAERMLGKAFEELLKVVPEVKPEGLALLTDHEFMQLVLSACGPMTAAHRMVKLLMQGITFEEAADVPVEIDIRKLQELLKTGTATKEVMAQVFSKLPLEIQRWGKAAMRKDEREACLKIPDSWSETLAQRCEQCKLRADQILLTVPSWTIVRNWLREGKIRILLRGDNSGYTVSHLEEMPSVLPELIPALAGKRLNVRVFVDPDLSTDQQRAVADAFKQLFRD